MKISLCFLSLLLLNLSCQKKVEKKACSKEKTFDMYQMSEMATLMEQMYSHNSQLRERIINKDTIGKFPEFFNSIFTAKFTDEADNDAFFKENAKNYITAQKLIYSDPNNLKKNFNDGVNACITCHEGKCGGPIPRIKKLIIK
jgi:hypothetical protein